MTDHRIDEGLVERAWTQIAELCGRSAEGRSMVSKDELAAALEAAGLAALQQENERLRAAATFAHDRLVDFKIAHLLRNWAQAGGSADAVSAVVNKLHAVLSTRQLSANVRRLSLHERRR